MGNAPSNPKPGTTFRVIGAGMSRTGTKTLQEALDILLDGPPHDAGVQSLGGPSYQQKLWLEIMELAPRATTVTETKKLDYLIAQVLDGYTSTMDTPANLLTPEIMRVFPDAIVIATTRDPQSWYVSSSRMQELTDVWYLPYAIYWIPHVGIWGTWDKYLRRMFVWRFGTERPKIETLTAHEDQLRSVVPKDKLFWYKVSDGWGPLCKMLDVPVPDMPFPHKNKPEEAPKVFRQLIITGLVLWTGVLGATGATLWFSWKYCQKLL